MKQTVFALAIIIATFWPLPSDATDSPKKSAQVSEMLARNRPPIAGKPYKEARGILDRHRAELMKLPGVIGVMLQEEGLLIVTRNPAAVPSMVEGLPVQTLRPPVLSQGHDHTEADGGEMSSMQRRGDQEAPLGQDCGPYAHWEPTVGRCRVDQLSPSLRAALARKPVPPPSGMVVLLLDGKRETAAVCPKGFREKSGQHGWRFCIDPAHPQPLPRLWEAPIAGIPFEEAQAILERHGDELGQISEMTSYGLGAEGIIVHTDQPALVPPELEGLPVKTRPVEIYRPLSHTNLFPQRPLRGSLKITDQLWPSTGTLTGIGISEGKPWEISYVKAQAIFEENRKALLSLPGVQGGSLGFDGIHLYTSEPEALPTEVEGLPVLAQLPLHGPIGDIPFLEAKEIWERHRQMLEDTPGVQAVFLSPGGIAVYTDQPDLLPEEIEELPVDPFPPMMPE